jgi:hypothetical protein
VQCLRLEHVRPLDVGVEHREDHVDVATVERVVGPSQELDSLLELVHPAARFGSYAIPPGVGEPHVTGGTYHDHRRMVDRAIRKNRESAVRRRVGDLDAGRPRRGLARDRG